MQGADEVPDERGTVRAARTLALPRSLLRAKTSVPDLHHAAVERPRLWTLLDAATTRPVTAMTAPTGSGKTQLLASWARQSARPVAWLNLDAHDRDPHRFWTAFLLALQPVAGLGEDSVLATMQPAPGSSHSLSVLPALVVDALSDLEHEVVVVLDDVHEIDDSPTVEALSYLLLHLPPRLRVVLTGVFLPALPRARLRLEGRLATIPGEELAFTAVEARSMLQGTGLHPTDEVVAQLVDRTEGWSAGLRLAALAGADALTGHDSPYLLTSGSAEADEYLLGEVLANLPEQARAFVLTTCVCDRLSGSLADALTGDHDGAATLRWLADHNIFTVRQSSDEEWYRYHAMFVGMLRRQLQQADQGRWRALHDRAAGWFAEHRLWLEAFEHARQGTSADLARAMVRSAWYPLYVGGQLVTLRDMVDRVLADPTGADDELRLVRTVVGLALGEPGSHLVSPPPATPSLAGQVLALEQGRACGDLATVQAAAADMLRAGPGLSPTSESFGDLAALALYELGATEYWRGDGFAAEEHLRQAHEAARSGHRAYVELGCLSQLVGVLTAQDRLDDALAVADEARDLAGRRGWEQSAAAAELWHALGWIHYLRDELDAADQFLDLGDDAVRLDDTPVRAAIQLVRGLVLAQRGRKRHALAQMLQVEREIAGLRARWVFSDYVEAELVRLNLALGQLGPARRALARTDPETEGVHLRISRAELLLSDSRPDAALDVLRAAVADGRGFLDQRIQAQVLLAVVETQQNGVRAGLPVFGEAVAMAAGERMVQPLLQFGARIDRMLELLERRDRTHLDFVRLVRSRIAAHVSTAQQVRPDGGLEEPLTAREHEILIRLDSMATLPEVAAELFVSVNTVKAHLRSLYRKLGVHGRREAIAKAEALGLL
ncbi:LuxR C-terminal-related transcriptional regulator [Pimelobacter sp. 30-1]|uniref:LuxR C-terminal-related transcriptional regulator n=1 Tax=Pimelobacter sp. 30-1 TaxID=2004991 RepID=UPI00207BA5C4|nr:LuxR C-terminal-related transcriptional regulator [Pimelobacter sp. 30-1]